MAADMTEAPRCPRCDLMRGLTQDAQEAGTRYAVEVVELRAEIERLRSVQPLRSGQVMRQAGVALEAMEGAVIAAITAAKGADVPQGLIVAILHAHAYQQTAAMVNAAPDEEPKR